MNISQKWSVASVPYWKKMKMEMVILGDVPTFESIEMTRNSRASMGVSHSPGDPNPKICQFIQVWLSGPTSSVHKRGSQESR